MGDAGPTREHTISSIAIIGAGPVGVAFAKYLIAEEAFSTIDLYEQRDRLGGIWNLSEPVRSRRIPIPQIDPRYGHRKDGTTSSKELESLELESPLYDYLETNIPKQLMAFSDKPFPKEEPLFPSHQAVLKYLGEYGEDVRHLIRFSTAVRDVQLVEGATGQEKWDLVAERLDTKEIMRKRYDAVVVANGHYTVPYVPNIKGVKQWSASYPGTIIHSKAYRKPEDFRHKKVIVIGNSASGLDIAAQVGKYAHTPVLLSSRSVSAFGTLPAGGYREDVDEIVEFLSSQGDVQKGVRFKSGRIERGIEAVIFATGYYYSYPFLSNLPQPIVTDGLRTRGTYEHLFNIDHPTLVLPVINFKVIPFPLSQNQAAVVARVWSGRLKLPSAVKMLDWERGVIQDKGEGKYFHLKKFPEDAAQINELFDWALKAERQEGFEDNGLGKLGTGWDERQVWIRSRFPEIKAAYSAKGESRFKIGTIEELGFDFNKWRDLAEDKDLEVFERAKCSLTKSKTRWDV